MQTNANWRLVEGTANSSLGTRFPTAVVRAFGTPNAHPDHPIGHPIHRLLACTASLSLSLSLFCRMLSPLNATALTPTSILASRLRRVYASSVLIPVPVRGHRPSFYPCERFRLTE